LTIGIQIGIYKGLCHRVYCRRIAKIASCNKNGIIFHFTIGPFPVCSGFGIPAIRNIGGYANTQVRRTGLYYTALVETPELQYGIDG
jgi:hypothetical protein